MGSPLEIAMTLGMRGLLTARLEDRWLGVKDIIRISCLSDTAIDPQLAGLPAAEKTAFLRWLSGVEQVGIRLIHCPPARFAKPTRLAEVEVMAAPVPTLRARLTDAEGAPHEVLFREMEYHLACLLAPDSLRKTLWEYGRPDELNLVALCGGVVVAVSASREEHFTAYLDKHRQFDKIFVVKESERVETGMLQGVGFVFALQRLAYMRERDLLRNRPTHAPVSYNILQRDLAAWCELAGIEVTPDLAENHSSGVLTRDEAERMWNFAVQSRMTEEVPDLVVVRQNLARLYHLEGELLRDQQETLEDVEDFTDTSDDPFLEECLEDDEEALIETGRDLNLVRGQITQLESSEIQLLLAQQAGVPLRLERLDADIAERGTSHEAYRKMVREGDDSAREWVQRFGDDLVTLRSQRMDLVDRYHSAGLSWID